MPPLARITPTTPTNTAEPTATPTPPTTITEPTAYPATNYAYLAHAGPPLSISGGPFLHQDHTTAYPHPDFLVSMTDDPTLLKLNVPFYLVYCNSSVNNSTAPAIDRFRYYLCASLARHHSYKVAYWNETAATSVGGSATTQRYREAYSVFEREFTAALESLIQRAKNKEESDFSQEQRRQLWHRLIHLEKTLLHETFYLWPQLFDRSFKANRKLLHYICLQSLFLYQVLGTQIDPRGFLCGLRVELRRQWIDLSDAVDVLDGRCSQYLFYKELMAQLSEMRGRLERWEGFIEDARAALEGDFHSVGARFFVEWWHREVLNGTRKAGQRMVGYEIMDGMGCVGWRRVLGARLLLSNDDWLRATREMLERAARARRERFERAMRERAEMREMLERVRGRARGKENVPPVPTEQVRDTAGDEWDPEASA